MSQPLISGILNFFGRKPIPPIVIAESNSSNNIQQNESAIIVTESTAILQTQHLSHHNLPIPPVEIIGINYNSLESFESSMRLWSRGHFAINGSTMEAPGFTIARKRTLPTGDRPNKVEYMCSLYGGPIKEMQPQGERELRATRMRRSYGTGCPFGIHGTLGPDGDWKFGCSVPFHNHPRAEDWRNTFPKLRKLADDELTYELQVLIKNAPPKDAIQRILATTGCRYTTQDLVNERRSIRFRNVVSRAEYFKSTLEDAWDKAVLGDSLRNGGIILHFKNAFPMLPTDVMDRVLKLLADYKGKFKNIQKYGDAIHLRTYMKASPHPQDYPPQLMELLEPMLHDLMFILWYSFESHKRTERQGGYHYGACHQPGVVCHLPGLVPQKMHRDSKVTVADLARASNSDLHLRRIGPVDINWVGFVGLTYDDPQRLLLPRNGNPSDPELQPVNIAQGDFLLTTAQVWHAGDGHPNITNKPSFKLIFEVMGNLHGANINNDDQDWWPTYVGATNAAKVVDRETMLSQCVAPYYFKTVL